MAAERKPVVALAALGADLGQPPAVARGVWREPTCKPDAASYSSFDTLPICPLTNPSYHPVCRVSELFAPAGPGRTGHQNHGS